MKIALIRSVDVKQAQPMLFYVKVNYLNSLV